MTRSPGLSATAVAALAAGAALLAFAYLRSPVGLCDPRFSAGVIAIGVAQALAVAGAVALRRAAGGGRAAAVALAAWGVATAAALAVRTCAGHVETLQAMDVVVALLTGAALALLLGGMAAHEKAPRPAGLVVVVAVAAAAGLGAAKLCEARAQDRVWLTWARMDAVASAFATLKPTPKVHGEIEPVLELLPPELREGLATEDAWGRPLELASNGLAWTLASRGADGKPGPYQLGPSRDFVDDLVVTDGQPVAWPESPCVEGPRPKPQAPVIDLRGR